MVSPDGQPVAVHIRGPQWVSRVASGRSRRCWLRRLCTCSGSAHAPCRGPGRHHYHAPCRGPGRHHYPRREPEPIPTPEPKPISPVPLERIDGACVLTVAHGTKAQRFGAELARLSLSPVRVKTRSLLSKPHVRIRQEQTWIAPRLIAVHLQNAERQRGGCEAVN